MGRFRFVLINPIFTVFTYDGGKNNKINDRHMGMIMNRPVKTGTSLHDIMNSMVQDPAGFADAAVARPTTEAEALALLDPLLAGLDKQKADADAHFTRLMKSHGGDDPMTCVAADMKDSAKSAYETRLLELQQDGRIMGMARRMIVDANATLARAERKAAALQQLRVQLFAGRTIAPGKETEFNVKMGRILSLLGTLQAVIDDAQKTLCLANDFQHACACPRDCRLIKL